MGMEGGGFEVSYGYEKMMWEGCFSVIKLFVAVVGG